MDILFKQADFQNVVYTLHQFGFEVIDNCVKCRTNDWKEKTQSKQSE